jgi:hypothetical protein
LEHALAVSVVVGPVEAVSEGREPRSTGILSHCPKCSRRYVLLGQTASGADRMFRALLADGLGCAA